MVLVGGEPGDLVVVVGGGGFVEDRSSEAVEAGGGSEAGRRERLVERVVFAVDVEVAERDQVVVPAVLGLRPSGKPFRDRFEFGDTVGGC